MDFFDDVFMNILKHHILVDWTEISFNFHLRLAFKDEHAASSERYVSVSQLWNALQLMPV